MDGPHGGGVSQAHSWPPRGGAWTCDEVVMATTVEAICGPAAWVPLPRHICAMAFIEL